MKWKVETHPEFEKEYRRLPQRVRKAILARVGLLAEFGPGMMRPNADTLNGSRYPNMKELGCDADGGVWRVAFAFDPERKAVLLVAGDKSGANEKRF